MSPHSHELESVNIVIIIILLLVLLLLLLLLLLLVSPQVPGVPAEQQVLARCYAAEALCNLHSPEQAAEQLQRAVALQDASGTDSATPGAAKASGDAGPVAECHVSTKGIVQVGVLVVGLFDVSSLGLHCSYLVDRHFQQ